MSYSTTAPDPGAGRWTAKEQEGIERGRELSWPNRLAYMQPLNECGRFPICYHPHEVPKPMVSLVEELEQEAYDGKVSLSNILRKAKAVAVKLRLKQPIAWVEAELNGYGAGEVPDYRKVSGRVKAHNPYVGLIPMVCADPEFERIISEHRVREPIGTIEHLLSTTKEPMVAFTGEKAQFLSRLCSVPDFPMYLQISPGSLVSLLDAVRNKVLDWSLSLQSAGIMGEGLSFRPEETAKVSGKGDTYNIGSIGTFSGNLGGHVGGNVSGTSTQNVDQELDKVTALVGQLRQYQGQMGLDPRQQAEVSGNVDAIDEELRGRKPKPSVIGGLLKSIMSVMEGAAGNLIASGVMSAISNINL